MALRFDATATGKLNGVEYRAKIFDSRFTGSATRLIDTENFVTTNLGEEDGDGSSIFKPREIELALATTEDLSVLTDAAEDDIRVELERQDSGQIVYKGYIAPNQYSDRPLFQRDVDQVRLTGSEGLNLLEKEDAGVLFSDGQDTATLQQVVADSLNQLYPNNLGIQVAINWYPEGSGTFPLAEEVQTDAYREPRPDGDFISVREALADTLRPFNLTVQQTVRPFGPTATDPSTRSQSLVWWVSQWGAYTSSGTATAFEFTPDLATTTERTEDLLVDLGTVGQDATIQPRHERTFERQRSEVKVTYRHPQLENYIEDGGLENGEWVSIDPDGFIDSHDNFSKTPPATSENQKVGVTLLDGSSLTQGEFMFGLRYSGELTVPGPDAGLRFEMQSSSEKPEVTQPIVRVKIGDTYFTNDTVRVTADAPANESRISTNPLPVPIPEGARLPVEKTAALIGDRNHKGFLTLTERASEGDTLLNGDLNTGVSAGDQLVFIKPTATQAKVLLGPFKPYSNLGGYGSVRFTAAFQNASGDRIEKNEFKVEVGELIEIQDSGPNGHVFDDVVLQPLRDGSAFTQTFSSASDGTVGEEEEFTTRIGSGPAEGIASAIKNAPQWGVGKQPSPVFPVSELFARERLRYFRTQNKRLRLRTVRDNPLLGHEYVRINGENFRVIATETTRTDGEYAVTLLQHKNYGTQ